MWYLGLSTRKPVEDSRWRPRREATFRRGSRAFGGDGISRTANALGVNYQALKNRLGRTAVAASGQEAEGAARFVELTPFPPNGTCECFLEWEDAGGAKMRVRLQGVGMPDLVALGRSFWDRQS